MYSEVTIFFRDPPVVRSPTGRHCRMKSIRTTQKHVDRQASGKRTAIPTITLLSVTHLEEVSCQSFIAHLQSSWSAVSKSQHRLVSFASILSKRNQSPLWMRWSTSCTKLRFFYATEPNASVVKSIKKKSSSSFGVKFWYLNVNHGIKI